MSIKLFFAKSFFCKVLENLLDTFKKSAPKGKRIFLRNNVFKSLPTVLRKSTESTSYSKWQAQTGFTANFSTF